MLRSAARSRLVWLAVAAVLIPGAAVASDLAAPSAPARTAAAPIIVTPQALATTEDTPNAKNVLSTAVDPDGDPMTVVANTNGAHGGASCTVAGVCTYTPDTNFNGPDTFKFTIADSNGQQAVGTVNVSVQPVNDAPNALTPQVVGGKQNLPTPPINVLATATDVDGDTLIVTATSDPANGTVTCTPAGICNHTPDPGFSGVDGFTFTVSDGELSVNGTVTVDVQANAVPIVASPLAAGVSENGSVTVNVVDDASDPNDDNLVVTVHSGPAFGTVVCTPAGACTYKPALGHTGADSFVFRVSDGRGGSVLGQVNVTTFPNGAPVIVSPQAVSTTKGKPATFNVLTGAVDPEGGPLTVSVDVNANNGVVVCATNGNCTYTPEATHLGNDTFQFAVTDNQGKKSVGIVNLKVFLNFPPVIVSPQAAGTKQGEPVDVNVLVGASDPDGDALQVVALNDGGNGILTCTPAGICTYTPNPVFTGSTFFTFTVTDGKGASVQGLVNVTVFPNNPPEVIDSRDVATLEDTPIPVDVLAGAFDPDGDTLTVVGWTHGLNGTVDCTAAGICTYTPAANWFGGPDNFTFTVSDGNGGTDTGTVRVTVASVNDPPTIVSPLAVDVVENTPKNFNVLVGAFDPDPGPDNITVISWTQPTNGDVTCQADGDCTYTPDLGYTGIDSFTYKVSDGNGGEATGTVNLLVAAAALCSNAFLGSLPTGYSVVEGTPGADNLHGGPGNDILIGYAGDDSLYGGGGDDILCGGDGNDRLNGGWGEDVLVGGGGVDRLDSGPGEDILCTDVNDPPPFTGSGTDILNPTACF